MKRILLYSALVVAFGLCYTACHKPNLFNEDNFDERLSGGTQTIFDASAGAFGHGFENLNAIAEFNHEVGDASFEATFITAPSKVNAGLGPLFNSVSCISCHGGDGRGRPPLYDGDPAAALLYRLSMPGADVHGAPLPVSGFGGQLQGKATFGNQPEAIVTVTYTEQTFQFADGEIYKLRTPQYNFTQPYISMPSGFLFSPRIAPPVFGLGLLENISEADILANADENDVNGDGISGKANYVWDVKSQSKKIGKFGWKLNQPNLLQQAAGAYNGDMGITTSIFPVENSFGQPQYDGLNDDYELSDSLLQATAFYTQTLQVPARRNVGDAQVQMGKKVFADANCNKCHQPVMYTATDVSRPFLSHQRIQPFTDLLLHDMGNGLADNRPDFLANGKEWRTAPLWGIGLTEIINGHNNFLHDGRARSLMEAVMWHDGEAMNSKNKVQQMSKTQRDALVAFLKSL
ncbi:MAG: hypothetical protein RI955_1435 [Bacteroidota bacterium]|jgi:CxxC motif-containing protein (DUF1111 family)